MGLKEEDAMDRTRGRDKSKTILATLNDGRILRGGKREKHVDL